MFVFEIKGKEVNSFVTVAASVAKRLRRPPRSRAARGSNPDRANAMYQRLQIAYAGGYPAGKTL